MKGTKAVPRRIMLLGLIFVFLTCVAIVTHFQTSIKTIDLAPQNEKEDYQYSFIEGLSYGELYCLMNYRYSDGTITWGQYNKFDRLSNQLVDHFTSKKLKMIYEYAARVLNLELVCLYHEEMNELAFMKGFAVESSKIMIDALYRQTYFSRAKFEQIDNLYQELRKTPNDELIDEFFEVVDTILLETDVGEKTPTSVFYHFDYV